MNNYFKDQEERAHQAELLAGITFEKCLEQADDNKAKAALLFGRAYWHRREPGRYEKTYDHLLAGTPIIHQRTTDEEAKIHIGAGRWPSWYIQNYFPHLLPGAKPVQAKAPKAYMAPVQAKEAETFKPIGDFIIDGLAKETAEFINDENLPF